MGIDTKGWIRKDTTIDQIKSHIEKNYGKCEVRSTHYQYFFRLQFKDEEDNRSLCVFLQSDDAQPITGVRIDLSFWGNSVKIIEALCNEFGGYILDMDCYDISEVRGINIERFNAPCAELTAKDSFKNRIAKKMGFANVQTILELCEEYKNISDDKQ